MPARQEEADGIPQRRLGTGGAEDMGAESGGGERSERLRDDDFSPPRVPSIDPGWVLHTVAQLPDEVTSFRRTEAGAIHYGCS